MPKTGSTCTNEPCNVRRSIYPILHEVINPFNVIIICGLGLSEHEKH